MIISPEKHVLWHAFSFKFLVHFFVLRPTHTAILWVALILSGGNPCIGRNEVAVCSHFSCWRDQDRRKCHRTHPHADWAQITFFCVICSIHLGKMQEDFSRNSTASLTHRNDPTAQQHDCCTIMLINTISEKRHSEPLYAKITNSSIYVP